MPFPSDIYYAPPACSSRHSSRKTALVSLGHTSISQVLICSFVDTELSRLVKLFLICLFSFLHGLYKLRSKQDYYMSLCTPETTHKNNGHQKFFHWLFEPRLAVNVVKRPWPFVQPHWSLNT